MPEYRLSRRAEMDLLDIASYGIRQFGVAQAREYRDKLKRHFEGLAENPQHYPLVPHIRKGYRRSVCGVHSIYYRINNGDLEIIRILGRQDSKQAF